MDRPTRHAPRPHIVPAEPPLSQQAYDMIRDAIITCRLPPGSEMSEATLAARCGMGKAPVRAALARLSQERLVNATPRRGYRVSPITEQSIHDLFDVRIALEAMAARRAAGRVSIERLVELDARWSEAAPSPGAAADPAFLAANKAFHMTIGEATGNALLVRSLAAFLDETDRLVYLGLPLAVERAEVQEGHKPLLDALSRGAAEEAGRLAAAHVEASKATRLDTVRANPDLLRSPEAALADWA